MKRVAHSLAWYLYWLLAIALGLVAALLISFKFLFEDIDHYRLDIQSYLSQRYQAEVHLGELKGSWNGWIPSLEIRSFAIDNLESQPGLSIGLLKAKVEIDPSQSLVAQSPVFSVFDFDGLKVRYDLSKVPDIEQTEAPAKTTHLVSDSGAELLTLLLHQSDINLTTTRIEFVSRNGEEISISPIHLKMQSDDVMHQLTIDAELVTKAGNTSVSFVAEVQGNPSEDDVDFYLNIQELDHELLNPWLKLSGLQFESFEGTQQIWGKVRRGKLNYLTGKTLVKNFSFREYHLQEFALHTALLRRDRSYQLQVTDVQLLGAKKHFNLPRISLDLIRRGAGIEPVVLMVDRVDVAALQSWIVEQPFMPDNISSVIKTIAPEGELQNLKVNWIDPKNLKSFELAADLNQIGVNAWGDVPELKGINGLVTANLSGGQIHLTSNDFIMSFPRLFSDKWTYSNAGGIIGWRFEDKGIVVASQLLNLSDQHVSASGRFSIYLPFSRDEQPLLNLQIGMVSSDGAQARHYIPPKEVGVETYNWLVDAIKSGHINRAGFILNGVTRGRLANYQLPAVQMFFDISDATFAYQPGWPEIKKSDAFIFFRNGELVAEAKGGTLYDSNIDFSWVHLPKTKDRLFVNGSVTGSASDLYQLLTDSPLKEEVGNDLDAWKMAGEATTHLELEIPLLKKKLPVVTVHSAVKNASFDSQEDRISFTEINGVVSYRSSSGLSADKLQATLFDQPVKARISSTKEKTQVFLDSAIESDRLRQWLDLAILKIVTGKIKYQARLDMCPGKTCNQLVVSSDLNGVKIDAPAPLAKVSTQKGHLSLISDLGTGYQDDRSAVRLNLSNQLRGIMVTKGQSLERAHFSLGGKKPEVPSLPGIWVDGDISYLDYDQLEQFIQKAGFANAPAPDSDVKPGARNLLQKVALNIERFTFDDIQLEELKIQLTPDARGWNLKASGPQLKGELLIPESESTPYQVDLQYLVLNTSDKNDDVVEAIPEPPVDAKKLPFLNFKVQQLTLNEKPMGQWSFELVPIVNGIVVENIKADLNGALAKGEVRWRSETDQRSYLTLRLDGDDFGKVLDAWGVSKALETKSLKSYLQLSWEGAPWEFDIATTDGEVQFTAKNGRLLDVGNAGNFLRVFGILNLQSVGRRLRLDFSDLFKSGVAFDEMKASYSIQKGVGNTTAPFVMTGPSVNMAMQGVLDLDKETVDKDIEVAIPVTGNIPLVSVLLGAPQVAGAVFLFDKLIGDPLAKFSTVKYHMSGDWSDPKIDIYEDKNQQNDEEDHFLQND
ncbi:MAG: YhdP family protein [Neptuniibacter sp.]